MAEHRTPDEPDDPDTPESEDGVEAYESDWYRSLQAVANREGNKAPSTEGASSEDDDASDDDDDDETTTDDEHTTAGKKPHSEPGEPGIWVVVTPDR